jgi:hypothetical protein
MATSKNAKIQFESGQTVHDYAAMTDSGDHTVHTISGGTVYSGKSGYEPIVRPNGVVSGLNMVSTHADNDKVTIAGFTAYSMGVLKTVTATTLAITRAASDVAKICSVTMTSAGAIAEVEGEDSLSAALSEVRGAAGGPPSIPADSVEIAQVRMTSNSAAAIDPDEIFQTIGTHTERFDYPTWSVNPVGDGSTATVTAKKNAYVELDSALTLVHGATATDPADLYKKVYIRYYSPTFVEVSKAIDFVPVENSHSVTSTQVYGNKSVGSTSTTIGQGSFTALLEDGLTDALLAQQDEVVTIKFHSDRNKTPYSLTQGLLGGVSSFPVDNQNQVACTISSETITARFSS